MAFPQNPRKTSGKNTLGSVLLLLPEDVFGNVDICCNRTGVVGINLFLSLSLIVMLMCQRCTESALEEQNTVAAS